MTSVYNSDRSWALIVWARHRFRAYPPGDPVFELADQLEAARREVERLTECMSVAGLQCFIRGGAPERVAEHMRRVVSSWMENEAKLTTERDAMRPVVEAVERWGDADAPRDVALGYALLAAVDAYRAAKGKA